MKVNPRVLDVTSTLEGEKIGMTIAQDALAHIMSVLTDLYSDPELAVIREYSTNAYDAHVESFVDRPIEITLPSQLSPYFKVRDYGAGLNVDDIREIYSQYGASTKRESDDVVGMLGLGCKSALTYTDQFTLTAVKDGICTQVSISRDEDGTGSMTIAAEYETDEPSGVEITVPAKKYNSFEEKAEDFFRFWKPGTVLVNGKAPKHIGGGLWISDDMLLTQEVDQSVVVMGNVAYPIPSELIRERWPLVAFVDIGAVQFTPSRESLQLTPQTKATIQELKDRLTVEKDPAIERMINEAETPREALQITLRARALGYQGTPTYKGQEIPLAVQAPEGERFTVADRVKRWRRKGYSVDRTLPATIFPNAVWFTNRDGEGLTPYQRQKLDQWLSTKEELNGTDFTTYIMVRGDVPVTGWIDQTRVFDWQEVKDQKIKREGRTGVSGRVSGSYEGYVDGQYKTTILATDIDTSHPVIFCGKRSYSYTTSNVNLVKRNEEDGYTLVLIGQNRVAKFQRDFPMAVSLNDYVKKQATEWRDSLTDEDRIAIHLHMNGEANTLARYKPERIDDPELAAAVKLALTPPKDLIDAYRSYNGIVQLPREDWTNPINKYPVLTKLYPYGTIDHQTMDHLYLYINAVYQRNSVEVHEQEAQN